jgi:hypothetical protein
MSLVVGCSSDIVVSNTGFTTTAIYPIVIGTPVDLY